MSKLTFNKLENLANEMGIAHADKEHFCFDYADHTFDIIFAFAGEEYELLVGILNINFGILLKVTQNFVVELRDDDYYALCNALQLNYNINHFTSNVFLRLLSNHIPPHYSGFQYSSPTMRPSLICRHVEESEKIYFKGWNDHKKDGRTARNFDKTEFYFGKAIADYCRKNNISSLWTDIPRDGADDHLPPNYPI